MEPPSEFTELGVQSPTSPERGRRRACRIQFSRRSSRSPQWSSFSPEDTAPTWPPGSISPRSRSCPTNSSPSSSTSASPTCSSSPTAAAGAGRSCFTSSFRPRPMWRCPCAIWSTPASPPRSSAGTSAISARRMRSSSFRWYSTTGRAHGTRRCRWRTSCRASPSTCSSGRKPSILNARAWRTFRHWYWVSWYQGKRPGNWGAGSTPLRVPWGPAPTRSSVNGSHCS